MSAETYKHYDAEVLFQISDTPFRSILKKNGVVYSDLPIVLPELGVISYHKDGVKKYAVIKAYGYDDYYEDIYITDSIPDDCDLEALVMDIDGQRKGEEPMTRKTKLKVVLDACSKRIMDSVPESENIFETLSNAPSVDDMIGDVVIALAGYGYDKTMLEQAESYDIDQEFLKKIKGRM